MEVGRREPKPLEKREIPEGLRVAVIEDHSEMVVLLKLFAEKGGHSIVGTAATHEEAQNLLEQFSPLGVQVVVLDGILGDDTLPDNTSDDDDVNKRSDELARQIKTKYPEVYVIGFAGQGKLLNADINVGKNVGQVSKVLNDLLKESSTPIQEPQDSPV